MTDALLEKSLRALDADRMMADIAEIATRMPGRLAGSPAGAAMAEFSAAALSGAGLDARIESYEAPLSFPGEGRLVRQETGETIPAFTCGHSGPTPPAGVSRRLIDIGGGTREELARLGPAAVGGIGLVDLARGPVRHEKQRLAAQAGLAGLVMFAPGAAADAHLPYGSVKPGWGRPDGVSRDDDLDGYLPCLGIARRDGLALQRALGTDQVIVTLHTAPDNRWAEAHISLGELAGPDDAFVLVGGHQDSWYGPSATDNASGSALMLELARVLAPERARLRRGITFGFWAGHETGTMVGSSAWLETNWHRVRSGLAAYLEIDQPGVCGATLWEIAATPEIAGHAVDAFQAMEPGAPFTTVRPRRIGDSSFYGAGIPSVTAARRFDDAHLARMPGTALGWWHHTARNDLERVDRDMLLRHARIALAMLVPMIESPILPFRYGPAASTLAADCAALVAPLGFAPPVPLVRLPALAGAVDALAERLRAAPPGAAEAWRLEQAFRAFNQILVPARCAISPAWMQDDYGVSELALPIPMLQAFVADAGHLSPRQGEKLRLACLRALNRLHVESDRLARDMEALLADFA